jgi:uncharacterized protein
MAQDNKPGSSGSGRGTSNRGFASMDPATQREIASKGGRSVPPEERSFSKDRALAAEAGRKGGEASHGGRRNRQNNTTQGGQEPGPNGARGTEGNAEGGRSADSGRKGGQG